MINRFFLVGTALLASIFWIGFIGVVSPSPTESSVFLRMFQFSMGALVPFVLIKFVIEFWNPR